MIAHGLVVTLAWWAISWSVGEATARLLFGPRYSLISSATRLPLGLAASVCVLETAGYFLPIRHAVWLLLPPAAYGALRIARAWRGFRRSEHRALIVSSLGALGIGLAPVAIAGRFTAAALTNNDGTYYITAADWLANVPWMREAPSWELVPPSACLLEPVLHLWHWRTGTPNLMAAVSSVSGLESAEALAVVTAVLFACLPCAAIGIARAVGVPRGSGRELLIGLIAACSAAPAFLGYQHMTGHLAAQSLFAIACGAILACVRRGGFRRVTYTALLFAACVALFADGAAMLVVISVAAIAAGGRRVFRSLLRTGVTALVTGLVGPFTLYRAARAGWNTLQYRLPAPKSVFPQRGWLERRTIDDLATLTGVDPWPPWPGAWPPDAQTLVMWLGAVTGVALLIFGARALRAAHGQRAIAAVLGGLLLLSLALIEVRYLTGKVLLTGAAFVVPLCALGAAELVRLRRRRWLVIAFGSAELVALGTLVRPSRWNVVDRPAHDELVDWLGRLPAGSLVAFDGLGAPADAVLDAHRAHRAALLADLRPVHPGLDGSFYKPLCADVERPDPLPARAYALQRVTSETLTQGNLLGEWDGFRLLEADLTKKSGFIAAWAPTHGWLAAEQEHDGRVFRWAEWQAQGTLRIVTPAQCARLRGQMRMIRSAAVVALRVAEDPVFTGGISAEWTPFETRAFAARDALVVQFEMLRATQAPPDRAHGFAVSRLAVEPVSRCDVVLTATGQPAKLPIDFDHELELSIVPPAASPCWQLSLVIGGERGASLAVAADRGPRLERIFGASIDTFTIPKIESARPRRLRIQKLGGAPELGWQLLDVTVRPKECSG